MKNIIVVFTIAFLVAGCMTSFAKSMCINKNDKVPNVSIPGKPKAFSNKIRQEAKTAIYQWPSFSLAAGECLSVDLPGGQSAALIRVSGTSPTILEGTLNVNGTLILCNPNGIVVGASARINGGNIFLLVVM
jgi:filamentous hemagglutinin family protein